VRRSSYLSNLVCYSAFRDRRLLLRPRRRFLSVPASGRQEFSQNRFRVNRFLNLISGDFFVREGTLPRRNSATTNPGAHHAASPPKPLSNPADPLNRRRGGYYHVISNMARGNRQR